MHSDLFESQKLSDTPYRSWIYIPIFVNCNLLACLSFSSVKKQLELYTIFHKLSKTNHIFSEETTTVRILNYKWLHITFWKISIN